MCLVPVDMQKNGSKVIGDELADDMTTIKGDGGGCGSELPQAHPKRDQIDDNLKRVYDDMLDDTVPDRFEDLLRQLREQDSQK